MTPAKLICPYARYDAQMYIRCAKINDQCTHQRWCMGKGWSVLTEQAGACPARKDDTDERKAKRAPKRRNKV